MSLRSWDATWKPDFKFTKEWNWTRVLSTWHHNAWVLTWYDPSLCSKRRTNIDKWKYVLTLFFCSAALGFYHMQSAYDRDEYVRIGWENIQSGTQNNFNKYTNQEVTHFNTTYDYYSVLHYGAYGFSKNGQPTIVPLVSKTLSEKGEGEKLNLKLFLILFFCFFFFFLKWRIKNIWMWSDNVNDWAKKT